MAKVPDFVPGLKELEGQEVYYKEELVGIEYPYIWKEGKKKKLSLKEWKELWDEYFHSSTNEGYWLMKDAKKEFGGVF